MAGSYKMFLRETGDVSLLIVMGLSVWYRCPCAGLTSHVAAVISRLLPCQAPVLPWPIISYHHAACSAASPSRSSQQARRIRPTVKNSQTTAHTTRQKKPSLSSVNPVRKTPRMPRMGEMADFGIQKSHFSVSSCTSPSPCGPTSYPL